MPGTVPRQAPRIKNTASEGASKEEKGDVVDPQSNTKKNTEPEKSSSNTKKKK